jgi:hypothetical protein
LWAGVKASYRGYGGSIIEDARAAYAFAVARYPAERLVL